MGIRKLRRSFLRACQDFDSAGDWKSETSLSGINEFTSQIAVELDFTSNTNSGKYAYIVRIKIIKSGVYNFN